jgi:hypothetical protein
MSMKNKKSIDKGGRPTKYKPTHNNQAYKLCLLGATDKELAEFFEVAVSTINEWKKDFPRFSESIKAGKVQADANVAHSLYQRATGYSHVDADIRVVNGKVITTTIKKHYPPDVTAQIYWTKNRAKAYWRERHDIGVEFEKLTDEQLETMFNKLTQKAKES